MSVRQIKEGSVQNFIDDLNYNFSLTARESGMELPEIKIKLTSQPTDWYVNYKSYYTKDTDTGEMVPITSDTVPVFVSGIYYKYYPPGFIFIKIPSSSSSEGE